MNIPESAIKSRWQELKKLKRIGSPDKGSLKKGKDSGDERGENLFSPPNGPVFPVVGSPPAFNPNIFAGAATIAPPFSNPVSPHSHPVPRPQDIFPDSQYRASLMPDGQFSAEDCQALAEAELRYRQWKWYHVAAEFNRARGKAMYPAQVERKFRAGYQG
jgi:hypothetical protein